MNVKQHRHFEHELPELEASNVEDKDTPSRRERTSESNAPMLKWLLLSVGVAGVLFLVWSFLHQDEPTEVASEETPSFSTSLEQVDHNPSVVMPATPTEPTVAPEVTTDSAAVESAAVELQTPAQILSRLQQENIQLAERVKLLEEKMTAFNGQGDFDQLKQQVGGLKAEILKQVDRRLVVVEEVVNKLKAMFLEKIDQLPFKVLSVDLWDSKPYATISADQKTKLIGVGEIVMGWKVDSIDFQQQRVVLSSGTEVKEIVIP